MKLLEPLANIFKIDHMNTHNGSGFRTVVYFKGCPLHCTWCHNPEGISPQKEVWWNKAKCIGCGSCVNECPKAALSLTEKGIEINRKKCTGCQQCTDVCPSKALEKLGQDYSVDELMQIIRQDKFLFESSGGGVTATGGEPGMQADFVAALFKACQEEGIHTAFDTSGLIAESALEKIIPHTDLIFLDIKLLDEVKSKRYTGLSVEKLQETVSWINRFILKNGYPKIEIRTPLVPKITDTPENMDTIGKFIEKNVPLAQQWELCLFNDLCEDKYIRMGKTWNFSGKKHSSRDHQGFLTFANQSPLETNVTGFVDKSK